MKENFESSCLKVLDFMREHFMEYKEAQARLGYTNEFRSRRIAKEFNSLIFDFGFCLDESSLFHKYGIGNNHEWNIVDRNQNPVGKFYATDNMYCGVILGVKVGDRKIDGFEICSGGFIREES